MSREIHYELLLPINLDKKNYPIDGNIYNNDILDNENNLNKYTNDKKSSSALNPDNNKDNKYNTNKSINNEKKSILKLQNKINIEDKYKEELISFVTNENSIYPKFEGCKNGDKRFEDIFNFLISEKKYNENKVKKNMA